MTTPTPVILILVLCLTGCGKHTDETPCGDAEDRAARHKEAALMWVDVAKRERKENEALQEENRKLRAIPKGVQFKELSSVPASNTRTIYSIAEGVNPHATLKVSSEYEQVELLCEIIKQCTTNGQSFTVDGKEWFVRPYGNSVAMFHPFTEQELQRFEPFKNK